MCIGPLQFSSLRPKTQKHKEILCRFDRGAPQVEPQNVQGDAVPPSLGTTASFEDSLQFGGAFLRSATGSRQVRGRP
jgi:hypothetical protein